MITLPEYDDLMKFEDIEYEKAAKKSDSSSTGESGISSNDSESDEKAADDIEVSLSQKQISIFMEQWTK